MKKGDRLLNLQIESMAAEGKCIARYEGRVIFVEDVAPGDIVHVDIKRVKPRYADASVAELVRASPRRAEVFCAHFSVCGGCKWQHVDYKVQLEFKQQQVVDSLQRIGGLSFPDVRPIIPSADTTYYRNRLDFTFSNKKWLSWEELKSGESNVNDTLGFHVPGMFDKIFQVNHCYLQASPSNEIRNAVYDFCSQHKIPFFDLREQTGFLRTLTIRSSSIGELMVILQVAYENTDWLNQVMHFIVENFPMISSVNYIINGKKNDTFADLDVICFKGTPYITEEMPKPSGKGKLQFRIGPKSFYQTNAQQAFELYKAAWQLTELKGDELVYDLYTGTGTIANFVAADAKQVIGLEYVADAIENAKVNARINKINNAKFFTGDIKDLLNDEFLSNHGRPDVIITDPPRAGMHDGVCKMILQASPEKIAYISCNPATQARDLKILCEAYTIKAVQPVDMFPHTSHVENIVLLIKKSS